MRNLNEEELPDPTHHDGETHNEIVALLAHRRPREEARRYPRFPSSRSLSGEYPLEDPFGVFLCLGKPSLEETSPAETGQPPAMEVISGFHVIDFSEEGLQIQFSCANPLKYAMKQLSIRVGTSIVPVGMQWLTQHNGHIRAGISFQEDIELNSGICSVLLELSNGLIRFLTHRHIPQNMVQYQEAAVFSYFCILHNLRLQYIQALASHKEAENTLIPMIRKSVTKQAILDKINANNWSKYIQLQQARTIIETVDYRDNFRIFMNPYYEFGCNVTGVEGRITFLEKEVVDILLNTLLFNNNNLHYSNDVMNQLQPIYEDFKLLRELLPELFQNEKFIDQFKFYSSLISAVMLSRDILIDEISNLTA
ncbi:MAG: hypothetical protein AB9873_01290 [Syntrophobacteraceae bacterium]